MNTGTGDDINSKPHNQAAEDQENHEAPKRSLGAIRPGPQPPCENNGSHHLSKEQQNQLSSHDGVLQRMVLYQCRQHCRSSQRRDQPSQPIFAGPRPRRGWRRFGRYWRRFLRVHRRAHCKVVEEKAKVRIVPLEPARRARAREYGKSYEPAAYHEQKRHTSRTAFRTIGSLPQYSPQTSGNGRLHDKQRKDAEAPDRRWRPIRAANRRNKERTHQSDCKPAYPSQR